MELDSRVKILRKELNISQEAFGSKLGVTGAGISKLENGQRNLTEQMIILICKEYSINEKWLRFGEGEMFKEKLPLEIEHIADTYNLDELDIKIILEYVKLNEKNRKVIKEYIMKIAKFESEGNYNNVDMNSGAAKDRNREESDNSELLADGQQPNEILKCAEKV